LELTILAPFDLFAVNHRVAETYGKVRTVLETQIRRSESQERSARASLSRSRPVWKRLPQQISSGGGSEIGVWHISSDSGENLHGGRARLSAKQERLKQRRPGNYSCE
jgi:hypothetical protein